METMPFDPARIHPESRPPSPGPAVAPPRGVGRNYARTAMLMGGPGRPAGHRRQHDRRRAGDAGLRRHRPGLQLPRLLVLRQAGADGERRPPGGAGAAARGLRDRGAADPPGRAPHAAHLRHPHRRPQRLRHRPQPGARRGGRHRGNPADPRPPAAGGGAGPRAVPRAEPRHPHRHRGRRHGRAHLRRRLRAPLGRHPRRRAGATATTAERPRSCSPGPSWRP